MLAVSNTTSREPIGGSIMRHIYDASIVHQATLKDWYAEAEQRRLAREVRGEQQGTAWTQVVHAMGAAARKVWQSVSRRKSNEGTKVLTNSKRTPTI